MSKFVIFYKCTDLNVGSDEVEENYSETFAQDASKEKAVSRSRNRKRTSKKKFPVFKTVLLALLALCIAAVIILSVTLKNTATELNILQNKHLAVYDKDYKGAQYEQGDTVQVSDFGLAEGRIPAYPGVPKAIYDTENIVTGEDGLKSYYVDNELCSYKGVDVSAINGDIDWNEVKAAGIEFAMIRLGGRGYGDDGVLYTDDKALENIRQAKSAGLFVGAYFFSQAISEEEAIEEAQLALSVLNGESLQLPVAFDWEYLGFEGMRTDDVTAQVLTSCARAFCDRIIEGGYKPMIYSNKTLVYLKYNLTELSDVDLWYAFYSDKPDMYYNYTMWQYSAEGTVAGISGDVDLNICFKNYT